MPDLLLGGIRVLAEQADRRHHEPRRAVPALEGVVLVECLLHRVKRAVLGKPLDRRDLAPVGLDSEGGARLDRLAVEQNSARAARGRVAADGRPRQPETLAQDVDEELPRLEGKLAPYPVDDE